MAIREWAIRELGRPVSDLATGRLPTDAPGASPTRDGTGTHRAARRAVTAPGDVPVEPEQAVPACVVDA